MLSNECHVAEYPRASLQQWQEVVEELNPAIAPEGCSKGMCRLQYEWLMNEYRSSKSDRYGRPVSDVFEMYSKRALDVLLKLKQEEDKLRASYA